MFYLQNEKENVVRMETMAFNLDHMVNTRLGNPMYKPFIRKKRFATEPEGKFRDSVRASEYSAKYMGKGTHSAFIDNIRLD